MRKRMYLIPAGIILFILFFTVFGEQGLLRIYHLKEEMNSLQKQLDGLKSENDKLKREIEALKSDRRYLESIARKDFGLVRPNEIIYQFNAPEKSVPAVAPESANPAPQLPKQIR